MHVLVGASVMVMAGAARVDSEARPFRVVSYNIQALAAGTDGVVAVLRTLAPDVVVLQEVDLGTRRSGGADQVAVLAKVLGMHGRFAPAMPFDRGQYGLAILSREPIDDVEVLALPRLGSEEPRIAVRARTRAVGSPVVVVNTHFAADTRQGDFARLRVMQARALKAWLDGSPGEAPVLLAGDFNAVPGSEVLAALGGAPMLSSGRPTYPADGPARALDHAFCWRGALRALREEVTASLASDHRPLVLDLQLAVDRPPAR